MGMSGKSLAPGTGKMRRELQPSGSASAQGAAAGTFYPRPRPRPSRSQRILGPSDPEPDGPKLLLMSHGGIPDLNVVAVNSELARLTVPQHFRIVYFFDPLATQSTTTWSCPEEVANWCTNAKDVRRWVYSGGKNPGGTTYVGRFPVVSFESDGSLGLFACPSDKEEEMLGWGTRTLKDAEEKLEDRFTRLRKQRVIDARSNLNKLAREAGQQQQIWYVEDSMTLTDVLQITSEQFKANPEDAAAIEALGSKEITIYIVSCSIKEGVRPVRRVDFGTQDVWRLQGKPLGGVRRSRRRARTRSARTRSARGRRARTRSARTRRSHS